MGTRDRKPPEWLGALISATASIVIATWLAWVSFSIPALKSRLDRLEDRKPQTPTAGAPKESAMELFEFLRRRKQ